MNQQDFQQSDALLFYKVGPVLVCSPTMNVRAVIVPPHFNVPPGANASEPGVFKSIHGMVRVVDLRIRFGVDEADRNSQGRVIIADVDHQLAGFWVDEIEDVVSMPQQGWSQVPPHVPREVFRRTLIEESGIRLYAEFDALDKFKSHGYLRRHIEQLKKTESDKRSKVQLPESADNYAARLQPASDAHKTVASNEVQQIAEKTTLPPQTASVSDSFKHSVKAGKDRAVPGSGDTSFKKPTRSQPAGSKIKDTGGASVLSSADRFPMPAHAKSRDSVSSKTHSRSVQSSEIKTSALRTHNQRAVNNDAATATASAATAASQKSNAKPVLHPVSQDESRKKTDRRSGVLLVMLVVCVLLSAVIYLYVEIFSGVNDTRVASRSLPVQSASIADYSEHVNEVQETPPQIFEAGRVEIDQSGDDIVIIIDQYEDGEDSMDAEQKGVADLVQDNASIEREDMEAEATGDASSVSKLSQMDEAGAEYRSEDGVAAGHESAVTTDQVVKTDTAVQAVENVSSVSQSVVSSSAVLEADEERVGLQSDNQQIHVTPDEQWIEKLQQPVSEKLVDELPETLPETLPGQQQEQQQEQQDKIQLSEETEIKVSGVSPDTGVKLQQAGSAPERTNEQTQPGTSKRRSMIEKKLAVKQKRHIHIVVKGDTLWDIAEHYVNNPWRYPELARLSKIKNPDLIYPGQKIIIILNYRDSPSRSQ